MQQDSRSQIFSNDIDIFHSQIENMQVDVDSEVRFRIIHRKRGKSV
jgi:hypothetical protein